MLSKTVVILISGKAGVGKTTVAKMLQSHLQKSMIVPFAQALKSIAMSVGWDGVKDDRGRRLLQMLGTTARSYNPDIWVELSLTNQLPRLQEMGYEYILVDDWRFPNERTRLLRNPDVQLFTIRINAPEREILKDTPAYYDVSETSLKADEDFYDIFIDNSDSLDTLSMVVQSVVKYIVDHTKKWE